MPESATQTPMQSLLLSVRGHRSLEDTLLDHLLLQVHLVFANGAGPLAHRLVLAHHDVLRNLVEQSGAC
jgi:hypothetical protein